MISPLVAGLLALTAPASSGVSHSAQSARPSSSASAPAPPREGRQRHAHAKPALAGVLNVNRASEAELRLLPGVGKGRAAAILERRGKRPFSSLDDLAHVRGMRGIVKRLHARLAVQGDTTLHPEEVAP